MTLTSAATPTRDITPTRGMTQVDSVIRHRSHNGSVSQRAHDAVRGVPTLLCASGRGGSGTSLIAALVAMAAAGEGYRVLLVDTDDMVGPLAALLGVVPNAVWQDLRGARVAPAALATPVSTTLTLVAGGVAQSGEQIAISAAERRACMRRLSTLSENMDLVVFDCGSRIDAIIAGFTPHADERLLAVMSGTDPVSLAATFALCKTVHNRIGAVPQDLLVNRIDGPEATRGFEAVEAGARQFLGHSLYFAGSVPSDPTLDTALRAGMPFPDAAAGSPAAIAAHEVVMRALAGTSPSRPGV